MRRICAKEKKQKPNARPKKYSREGHTRGKNTKGEGKQKEFINNPMLPDHLPNKRRRKRIKKKP